MKAANYAYPRVVKIITTDDGEPTKDRRWHLVVNEAATDRSLCTGDAFGIGDSGAEYKEKIGKVTCAECIKTIKWFKRIKL